MSPTPKQDKAHSGRNSDFDKDQPSENAGGPLHRGGTADEAGQRQRKPPSDGGGAIPPLPEPNVEGVGNEGGD